MERGARIVNVSSGAGSLAIDGRARMPAYNVSKAAMNAITRVLAADLRRDGILVNSVCPGWVRTDMGGAWPRARSRRARRACCGRRGWGRTGRPAASSATGNPVAW